jgi:hypothetical protein
MLPILGPHHQLAFGMQLQLQQPGRMLPSPATSAQATGNGRTGGSQPNVTPGAGGVDVGRWF